MLQKKATQTRNPEIALNQGKKKKKKQEPKMLGPERMQTSFENSRFKSAFGKLDAPVRKEYRR